MYALMMVRYGEVYFYASDEAGNDVFASRSAVALPWHYETEDEAGFALEDLEATHPYWFETCSQVSVVTL